MNAQKELDALRAQVTEQAFTISALKKADVIEREGYETAQAYGCEIDRLKERIEQLQKGNSEMEATRQELQSQVGHLTQLSAWVNAQERPPTGDDGVLVVSGNSVHQIEPGSWVRSRVSRGETRVFWMPLPHPPIPAHA